VNPPKLTDISSPVEIVASATIGVGAAGSAWTVARAGGGTVVVVAGTVVVVVAGTVVVVAGTVVVVAGVVVAGADVSGAELGPNESAQFVADAQDLKLKPKKTPIIWPGGAADSTNTSTMRYLLSKAVAKGSVIVRDDPTKV
jgi:hypothetical protein